MRQQLTKGYLYFKKLRRPLPPLPKIYSKTKGVDRRCHMSNLLLAIRC